MRDADAFSICINIGHFEEFMLNFAKSKREGEDFSANFLLQVELSYFFL